MDKKLKGALGNFDWKKLLAIIPIAVILVVVKQIYDFTEAIVGGIGSVNEVIDRFAGIEKSISKVLNAKAFETAAEGLKKVATSIAILAGAVVVLSIVDETNLYRSVGVIVVLSIVLTLLAKAMTKMQAASATIGKDGLKIAGVKTGLLTLGAAILLLAYTVKLMGSMKIEEAKQGFIGLVGLILTLVSVFAAYGLLIKGKAAQNMDKAGEMLFKMSTSLLILVWVTKLLSGVTWPELGKAAAFMTGFTVFVGALVFATKFAGRNISKVGSMLVKMSIAIALMVGVCKLVNLLSLEEMEKGALFAEGFLIFVGLLVAFTTISGSDQIAKVGGLLMSISTSMLLMIGVCKLAAKLTAEEIDAGIMFMGGFLVFVALLVAITTIGNDQKIAKVAATLIAMSIAVAILAGVAVLLSLLDPEGLMNGVTAVVMLSLGMAAMAAAAKGAEKCVGNILALSLAVGIMAGVVAALTFVDQEKLWNSVITMEIMMGMFALIMKMTASMEKVSLTLLAMSLAIGVLGGVLYLLSTMPAESSIGAAIALSMAMLAFAGVMNIISGMQAPSGKALVSIGIMALVVGALGGVLYLLQDLDPVQGISIVGVIAAFFIALEVVCLAATAVGKVAKFAIPGLAIIVGFIGALGLVVIGLAALAMDVIAGMPKLGSDLSAFMTNVQPFINGIQNIPDDISDKIGKLSAAILKLTGTEIVNAIASFFTGGSSLSDLGTELQQFGEGMASFSSSLGNIDAAIASISKIKDIQDVIKDIDLSSLSTMAETLDTCSEKIVSTVQEIVVSIQSAFKSKTSYFLTAGQEMASSLNNGLNSKKSTIDKTAKTIANSAASNVRLEYNSFYSAGNYLVEGFAAGISASSFKAEAKAVAMAQAALDAAKAVLRMNSPSKATREIGEYFGQGFINGISSYADKAYSSSSDMANSARAGLSDAISRIQNVLSSDIDSQPTIRPVLDLSDITTNASKITSLFDMNPSVGVMANVGAISRNMSFGQNGSTNDDVINAIKGLKDSLSKPGDTYTIGNITYDDGSEVSNAIKTLVRAAKIERRV